MPKSFFKYSGHRCVLPPDKTEESLNEEMLLPHWKLKKICIISETNLNSQLVMRSHFAIKNEQLRHLRQYNWFVVHPFSELRRFWEMWMLLVLSASFLFHPFQAAFKCVYHSNYFKTLGDPVFHDFYLVAYIIFVIDFFAWLDIILNFFSGYFIPSTKEIILSQKQISTHYLKTYFFPDFLSSIPVDFFKILFLKNKLEIESETTSVLQLMNLFKIVRTPTFFKYFRSTCENNLIPHFAYQYASVTFGLLFIIHWQICITVIIPQVLYGSRLYTVDEIPYNTSWIVTLNLFNKTTFDQYCLTAFRILTDFTGLGFDTSGLYNIEDQILAISFAIIGHLYWLFMMVVFLQGLITIFSPRTRFSEIMDQIRQYMTHRQLPLELQKKIVLFYRYRFQSSYFRENMIFGMMSTSLRKEILMHDCQKLIENVEMFKGLSDPLLTSIVSCLKSEVFLPNDVIVKAGSTGNCMYFVSSGTVAVFTPTGKEICHLHDGDYFGEVALIMENKRTATVIAIEVSELYRFESVDFVDIILSQPEVYAKIAKIALDRYQATTNLTGVIPEPPPNTEENKRSRKSKRN